MRKIIEFKSSGEFKKTRKFLANLRQHRIYRILDRFGQKGVSLLAENTPVSTGETAASWDYIVEVTDETAVISWTNSHMGDDGVTPVAILIQMGHGTRTGGYVTPVDYINPVMKPLFDEIVKALDKEVVSL